MSISGNPSLPDLAQVGMGLIMTDHEFISVIVDVSWSGSLASTAPDHNAFSGGASTFGYSWTGSQSVAIKGGEVA
ncbi:MAG: hypothetical protein ACYDB7_07865, partial [Mycobacteriales bacterium]